ncbi:hypothetical protein [Sphingomonas sp. BE270]|nr:hypothetical protein [Sphingomonas sp. BE270]
MPTAKHFTGVDTRFARPGGWRSLSGGTCATANRARALSAVAALSSTY